VVTLGEAFVRIRPDLTGFGPELKAALERNPPQVKVRVDLDTARLPAQLAQVRAMLRDVGRQRITLDADTGGATAQIARVKAELREVDGRTARARVDVNVDGALRGIALVTAALAAVTGLAVGAGLAVGVGAIAGAGIGAAVAGLAGIGVAVKALGDAEKGAGEQAAQAAQRQLSMAGAMDRVRDAQASLRNTQASAADAVRRAADQEASAQRDLVTAQRAVNTARAEAAAQIRDLIRQQQVLARQSEDLAAAQRGSLLDIRQAQEDLDRVRADPHATQLQRDQAQFAFDEAVRHNKDLKRQAADLTAQQKQLAAERAAANRRGIEGSDQVRAAQARVVVAQRAVRDAALAAAATQRQAAFQVAQAQGQVVDAQRAVQAASISAGTVGQSAMDKIADSMRQLSPAGQEFARFLRGFIDGPVRDLRMATQTGLLPGLQAGLASLGPVIAKNLPAFQAFAKVLGQALGGLITTAGKLTAPFLKLATVALQGLAPLEGILGQFADDFGKMVDQVVGDGSLQRSMGALVDLFRQLLPILPTLLPLFVQLASDVLPPLADLLVVLLPLIADLAVAFGPVLVDALRLVTPPLRWFGDFARDHPALVRDLAIAIGLVAVAVKIWAERQAILNAALKAWAIIQGILNIVLAANPIGLIVIAIAALVVAFIYAWQHSERFRNIVIGVFLAVDRAKQIVIDAIRTVARVFGEIPGAVADAGRWVGRKFGDIIGFVRSLPGRFAQAGRGIWDWLKAEFLGAINWVITQWNSLHFDVPAIKPLFGPTWGGFSIGVPPIAPIHLAAGGIVGARPGGVFANIAEGGRDEVVSPLNGPGGLEDSLYRAMTRALNDGYLRLEPRGTEVLARLVRKGELSLSGL